MHAVHFAGQLPWSMVDLVCAVCVTSLPAINNIIIHHLLKHLSSYWGGGDPGSSPSDGQTSRNRWNTSGRHTSKNNGGASVISNSDEETKQITVQRDIDVESMRTEPEHNHNHDPGFLELNDSRRNYRSNVGT